MSSSKGNTKRTRPQKYQNRTAYKNDLYDNSVKTKFINSIQPSGICSRCKAIIEWKIKYKKFKPLTAPRKCVRCEQKTVKNAYHVMCGPCSKNEGVCAKCCQKSEVVEVKPKNSAAEDEELQQAIKSLPERKRRTLLRYLRKQNEKPKKKKKQPVDGNKESQDVVEDDEDNEVDEMKLLEKINKLKLDGLKNKEDGDISDFGSDFTDSDIDFSGDDEDDEVW